MEYINTPMNKIGRVVTGKTPSTAIPEYYGGEIMFITPTELHADFTVKKSDKTITQAGFNSIRSNTIQGTSVMVGCIGWDMGNVALCTETCATNQQINSVTDIKSGYNPLYLYYWLRTKKDYLFSIASVTRTPILSKSTFEEILVPMPRKDRQDAVAHVLSAIDKKIVLNNGINDNLEQMAYDTYMHLFFKKQPNGKLREIIVENNKSSVQVGEAKGKSGNCPFFTSGDAILEWDCSMVDGRNSFLNTGGNAAVKFYIGEAAYSTDTWCITANRNLADYLYLLLLSIKPELNQKFFQGTGLKHLQKPLLKDRLIYIPSKNEIKGFNSKVQPLMNMISVNTRENKRLTTLRDWLLPMLINGQATVSD